MTGRAKAEVESIMMILINLWMTIFKKYNKNSPNNNSKRIKIKTKIMINMEMTMRMILNHHKRIKKVKVVKYNPKNLSQCSLLNALTIT